MCRPDYPARIGRIDGLVLVDFIGLMPEVHGDPHEEMMATLDIAEQHDPLAMLIRIRNSRPPPQDTRDELVKRMLGLQDRMRCICIAVESSGFRGVAFRSFLAGARLLGAVEAPLEVAAKLDEAKKLFAQHVPEYGSFEPLVEKFFDVPPPEDD